MVTASPTRPMSNLWRMRSYIRPRLWTMFWMLLTAAVGTAAGIAVPLVVQHVVDGPVRHHQLAGLLLLGGDWQASWWHALRARRGAPATFGRPIHC